MRCWSRVAGARLRRFPVLLQRLGAYPPAYGPVAVDPMDDEADLDRKLSCPVLVLWGANQAQQPGWPSMSSDIVAAWMEQAVDVRGKPLACGHFVPEGAPHATFDELMAMLAED